VWWREARPVMSRTIKECDGQLRNNFEGATVVRNGVVLMKEGIVVDVEAWKERVKVVFDRRKEYYNKWVLRGTQSSEKK